MKIKGIICLTYLILLGGYYSADAAPMMGQAGTNMNMQGTCLTENDSAAQVSEILNGDNEHGGIALSRNGQMQPTRARFNGILSTDTGKYGNHLEVTQQERLNIGMCVTPDQQHLGQFADIVNVASYTPAGSQETWMFMRSGQNAWQSWDGNLDTLVPAEARRQLMGQNRLTIHDGQLQAPGSFRIQAGYRLQDGTAVLCGAPVEFIVE